MTQPPPPPASSGDDSGGHPDQPNWTPPASADPNQWGQQPPAQQPWAQPAQPGQWPAPQPQVQWGQPGAPGQAGAPPGQWDYLGPEQGSPPSPGYPPQQPPRRRGPLIIAAVAAVALIGGGAATYIAVSDKGTSGGAGTPQGAVTSIVKDLNASDLLGLLDHLAPGERDALVNPVKDSLDTEKRVHVLKPDADLSKVSGAQFNAQNLTFDKTPESINDHVQIVKLTGGTITVNSDLSKVPFTDEFLHAAFPHGLPSPSARTYTVDLAKVVRDNGEPIRIAAQKSGGKWYPSILYTIADNATHSSGQSNPGPDDYVAPSGASSPEDAVRQVVDAASKQDFRRLIELTAPDELAALHDYAGLILRDAPAAQSPTFTVKSLELTSKKISGGTRVSLKSVTVEAEGEEAGIAIDGSCVQVNAPGQSKKYCASDGVSEIEKALDKPLTAEQRTALEHLFSGLPSIGVDTTESDGKWYVNPLRTYFDLSNSQLSGLQGNDLIILLGLIIER